MSPSHLSEARTSPKKTDFSFLWSGLFWAFQIGNILEGLGYFMPQIYLFSESIVIKALNRGTKAITLLTVVLLRFCQNHRGFRFRRHTQCIIAQPLLYHRIGLDRHRRRQVPHLDCLTDVRGYLGLLRTRLLGSCGQ